MATMTTGQRAQVWADLMTEISRNREGAALVKADLRAAIDAADQWASDNAASFNTALPIAARNALTGGQKARLLSAVLQKRFAQGV